MKVLHVIPSVSEKHGGPSFAIRSFSRASKLAGDNVTIATTNDDGDASLLDVLLGQAIEREGSTHYFFRRETLPYKISFGLARWLSRNVARFDVIHIHALFSFSSYAAARAARKHGVPYIIRPLGVLNRWGMENRRPFFKRLSFRWVELPILRHAAAIHYTAEAERLEAGAVNPEIRGLPSFVIPVPVEAPPIRKSEGDFMNRFPQAQGKRIILFLSRIDPKKGLEVLLESFASIHTNLRDVLLVIAGDGQASYVDSLRRRAEQLDISKAILWAGHLQAEEKALAFAMATVFVLPSHSENFGIAAAEALASSVPTILSDQVALSSEAGRSEAAMVVPPEVEAVRSAIVRVLGDADLRSRLGTNGAALARKMYSPKAVGAALAKKYREILT